MAEWRAGRGWSRDELTDRLAALGRLRRSFPEERQDEMTPDAGWRAERSESLVAREPPGPPVRDGPFERAAAAVASFDFSDARIVIGYFDPREPLLGRRMILELHVLGLRYLCGVVVARVARDADARRARYGFRYDTLEGHIERGSEWFLVTKDHDSGEVRFRIQSRWRPGDFPNWWSRVGFLLLARRYRALWLRRAHEHLRALATGFEVDKRDVTSPAAG